MFQCISYFWESEVIMKKLGKIFLIFIALLIVGLTLVFFFISPITKYVIEKNGLAWTGRKITIGKVNVKAFNGSIYIKDIKIYEANSDSVFFDCHDIYLKVNLKKMIAGIYEVYKIKIDNPEIRITQDGNTFNFDDLVKRFSSPPTEKPVHKGPEVHFDISNVIINNGNITYNDMPIHNIFRMHNLNFNLPQISSANPESKLHLDFKYGTGGFFNIDLDFNSKTFDYNLALLIDKYDLSQYYTPLNSFIAISSLKGELTTKLRVHGKFNNPKNLSLVGYLNINDVEIKDPNKRKFFALRQLSINIDSINVKQNLFAIRHIVFDRPYFEFDDYPVGNNFSRMIKYKEKPEKTDTTRNKKLDYTNMATLAQSSFKAMAVDYLGASYHADSIVIRNGEFEFNDYTPEHNFHYNVSRFNLLTDEIGKRDKIISFSMSAALDDTGKLAMKANLNYDLRNKQFSYDLTTLDISDISPITKYMLEKNSVRWTGRRITTSNIKVKPLKGSIYIKDIKIYEADSTNVFFDCHDVYIKINLKQMLNNEYEVDKIKIDNPEISIIQNGNSFNFDDLVKRFSSDPNKPADTNAPAIHYDINKVLINHGNITYNNVPIHNIFRIHDLNFNLPEVSWNKPVTAAHLDFTYGIGGFFNVDVDANRATSEYNLALSVTDYDLSQYYAPLNCFINISSLKGLFNTKLKVHGKFNSPKDISASGFIHINDLELKDTAGQKVLAFGELGFNIDTINVKQNMYYLHNILLDKPYVRFDYYPNGNNISQMIKYTSPPAPVKDNNTGEIKPDYSNVFTLFSSSIKMMAVDFNNTNYHTDSVIIQHGQFVYNDYTLDKLFHYNISNINITTDKISAAKKSIQFDLFANLNDTGKFVMNADISLDLKDMLLRYDITDVRISDFNPYSEYYVATPFADGYLRYNSTDSVVNRNLKSTNAIHIAGVKTGKKTYNKPVYKIPVRMAISLLKDEKDNIDLKIPAKGNLDDPDYKMGPLIGHIISELIVKTAESPFKQLAKLFDRDPEDMKQIPFEYMQDKLAEKQLRKLDDVYKVLEKKKEMNVEIIQLVDSLDEKDELALKLARKQYYDETQHIVNDSLLSRRKKRKEMKAENKIAAQDSLFDKYLNEKLKLNGTELMGVEDKCIKFVGDTMLIREVHKMIESRNREVSDFLIHKKELSPLRVKVVMNKDTVKAQNLSQPVFEIKYSAED